MQVAQPNSEQYKISKMDEGKVFVAYYETEEIQALPKHRLARWNARTVPKKVKGSLHKAVQLAQQAVDNGAPV